MDVTHIQAGFMRAANTLIGSLDGYCEPKYTFRQAIEKSAFVGRKQNVLQWIQRGILIPDDSQELNGRNRKYSQRDCVFMSALGLSQIYGLDINTGKTVAAYIAKAGRHSQSGLFDGDAINKEKIRKYFLLGFDNYARKVDWHYDQCES